MFDLSIEIDTHRQFESGRGCGFGVQLFQFCAKITTPGFLSVVIEYVRISKISEAQLRRTSELDTCPNSETAALQDQWNPLASYSSPGTILIAVESLMLA